MVLHLGIVPDRPSYRPGELLTATAEVFNEPSSSGSQSTISIIDVTAEVVGHEYVDPAYIGSSFHEDVPAATMKNSRRLCRTIFRSANTTLLENCTLELGARRLFLLQVKLPETLPPFFKGTSIRFDYCIDAEARYVTSQKGFAPHISPDPSVTSLASMACAVNGTGAHSLAKSSGSAVDGLAALPDTLPLNSKSYGNIWQSTLVKVPLSIWPLEVVDCHYAGLFLVGDDVESTTPSIVYQLGCPNADLAIHSKETSISELACNTTTGVNEGDGLMESGPSSRAMSRPASANRSAPAPTIGNGGPPIEEDVFVGPLELTRKLSRWSTLSGAVESGSMLPRPPLVKCFNIRMGDNPLVRLALHPPLEGALQPGTSLMGTLDFRKSQRANLMDKAAPKCIMVVITLENEEVIAEKWLLAARSGIIRKIYDEHVELTPDTTLTHFAFTVPRDSPASFSLPVVSIRWLLRFEFSVQKEEGSWTKTQEQTQLVWKLPVLVRPPG